MSTKVYTTFERSPPDFHLVREVDPQESFIKMIDGQGNVGTKIFSQKWELTELHR